MLLHVTKPDSFNNTIDLSGFTLDIVISTELLLVSGNHVVPLCTLFTLGILPVTVTVLYTLFNLLCNSLHFSVINTSKLLDILLFIDFLIFAQLINLPP